MTCSWKTALSIARNNSRVRTKSIWAVLPDDHGFDVQEVTGFVPYRISAAFKNGRRIGNGSNVLKQLAVVCGNHPYENGE